MDNEKNGIMDDDLNLDDLVDQPEENAPETFEVDEEVPDIEDTTSERLTDDEIESLLEDSEDEASSSGGEQQVNPQGAAQTETQTPAVNNGQMNRAAALLGGQPRQRPSISTEAELKNVGLLMDIYLQVTVELGRKNILAKDILGLGEGSIIELDKPASEPVELLVNDRLVARGEVVVIDENFGVRVTEIVDLKERLLRNTF